MYCKRCGQNIDERAAVCPNCGEHTDNYSTATNTAYNGAYNGTYNNTYNGANNTTYNGAYNQAPAQSQTNTLAIVGFVLSFFIALAGLICSIIGYRKSVNEGLGQRGLAIAGIIISAVSRACALIYVITIFAVIFGGIAGGLLGATYY